MIKNSDIKKLKNVEIKVFRAKKQLKLNAYTIWDEEFLGWVAKRMKTAYSKHRLRFRLELLKLVKEVL